MGNKTRQHVIKRMVDITFGVMLLVLFLPLMLATAILIAVSSPGHVIFTQLRPGYLGKPFSIYKFRTMYLGSERMEKGKEVVISDPRITIVGRFLRRTKIDELPQLVNVIRGDMSLVGPRPERMESVEEYSDSVKRRLDMRPGMTGLAQVSGNIFLPLKERYFLDVYYVDHFSLLLDLRILIRTIGIIMKGEKAFRDKRLVGATNASIQSHSRSIIVFSQYFFPEEFKINDICNEFILAGYNTTVICGIPNYPEGRFFTGYSLVKKRKEVINGVNTIRLPIYPRGKGSLSLLMNYLSFIIAGYCWTIFKSNRVSADCVFVFGLSPLLQALPAVLLAKLKRIPLVLYVQDLWPDSLIANSNMKSGLTILMVKGLVRYIYQNCASILATSYGFVKEIMSYGIEENRVIYLPQYAEVGDLLVNNAKRSSLLENRPLKIIYTGNIGHSQGLDVLPKAVKLVLDRGYNVEVTIVGSGRYRELLEKETKRLLVSSSFRFLARIPQKDVPVLLSISDFAFLSLRRGTGFDSTVPAKLQTYMACGKPIIASATGEVKRIIEEAGAGICSPPNDERGLADAIITLCKLPQSEVDRFSKNSIKYCREHFDRRTIISKLLEIIACAIEDNMKLGVK